MKKKLNVVGMFALICGLSAVLVGCDEMEDIVVAENSKTIVTTQTSTTDDNDESYYRQIEIYFEEVLDFNKKTFEIIQTGIVDSSNEADLIQASNDFLLFSQSHEPVPITNQDKLLHEHYEDLKYDAEQTADYALQYIYKKEKVYKTFHRDFFDNTRIHMRTISDLK